MNPEALRAYLGALGSPVSYAQARRDMGASHMRNLTEALETLMDQDAAAGRPYVAAMVISRSHPLPNRGFFDHAARLGREVGDPAAFHASELAALGKAPAKT